MTTYFPFTPSAQGAPSFQPTLDGNVYNVVVTFNLFGQRYYLNCYDQAGDRIFTVAVVETAESLALEDLSYDLASLTATATTSAPHGYPVGTVPNLTISGATPAGYNGAFPCLVTGPSTFTFGLASDPGQISSAVGEVSYLISLCAGYFDSTLVFRDGQFEVNP